MLTGHPNTNSRTGAHAGKLPRLLVLVLLSFLWPQHILAQAPIDSSRFDWFVPLHTNTPPGYFCEPLELGDGNMLAWWATFNDNTPPFFDEAYGSVVSPEGLVLITDQVIQNHVAKLNFGCSGFHSSFYQMEVDLAGIMGPFINAISVYRILADYSNNDLLPVAEQVLFTLEDSLALGPYRTMVASDSRLLVVHGVSDAHVDSARYLGNRLVLMDALTLDVYLDTLLVDDQSRYLLQSVEGGFFLRGGIKSAFIGDDAEFDWAVDNTFGMEVRQLHSDGQNLVFAGRTSGDSVLVVRQDRLSGVEMDAQLVATDVESNGTMAAQWLDEQLFCVFAGDEFSDQSGSLSVFDAGLNHEVAFVPLDTTLTVAKMVGPDLIRFST
ncbi:MAG: hypothetical protein KC518_01660, partial [Candidatus Cloacimonetes bacterium]|nr:hypothetical protein [Candidatus Cloacimonadota bacterium]